MKVIFLDFDGVITIPPKWYLKADKIKWIKKIVDETDAKIVVSSSWRMDSVEETIDKMIGRPKRCPRNKMLNWLIIHKNSSIHESKKSLNHNTKESFITNRYIIKLLNIPRFF